MTKQQQIEELEKIMHGFGEVHSMLARTKLLPKEYNPISGLFAKAKVDLFNYYLKIKNDQ